MKLTRRRLRRIILEETAKLQIEGRIASVSDLARSGDVIDNWASSLLDALVTSLPNGRMLLELKPETRQNIIEAIRSAVISSLITPLGGRGLDPYARRKQKREDLESAVQRHKWGPLAGPGL